MEHRLDAMEIRILGSLIEKELSTPEYYPLSLNALTNACNQKSNRDPVVVYDEADVEAAVDRLIESNLVWKSGIGRVPKYEERFTHERSLVPRESSVLCVLLLRGPQTIGEIRSRTARLHEFQNLEEVKATLDTLQEWGLVYLMPRMPGHKEPRYGHLLGGETETSQIPAAFEAGCCPSVDEIRFEQIENNIEALCKEVHELKSAFDAFRKQFD
jgi:hypothetical protein